MTAPPPATTPPGVIPPAVLSQPTVTVRLLSLGRLHFLPGEPVAVFTHRHMMSLYLVVLFCLIGFDTSGSAAVLPIELRGAIYVLSMIAFMSVIALSFQIAFKISARRGALSVHLSPILFVATLCAVAVGETIIQLLVTVSNDGMTRSGLLILFHYMVGELASAVVAHRLMPVILAELRGLPIRTLAETDPMLWVGAAQHPTPEPASEPASALAPTLAPAPDDATGSGFLVAGGRSFAFKSVTSLRAEGNYVHLFTADKRELLPGPLSDLVGQMPEYLGRQVHRSHWVATRAVLDWHADGREISLHLADGQTVPVAITRRREVRDWLVAHGLPRRAMP